MGSLRPLEIVFDIWQASGDSDVSHRANVRKYRFTHDHFQLTTYLKMRVFLAIQIMSQMCIRMIRDVCETDNDYRLDDYKPMIELFDKVDRLVDIMNGASEPRNVENINEPRHKHVLELFGVLRLFEEWREECGGFNENFIAQQTWEDLVWMVFGVAGAACNLEDDGSLVMHQGRSGSDVCEHFFSQVRYINSNPNAQQAREGASALSGDLGMHGHSFQSESRGNAGKRAGTTAEDLFAPINMPNK